MYTSGQFYHSLQYECLTYLGGWKGVGRLISDRMSYRNHYMCSGEATSIMKSTNIFSLVIRANISLWNRGLCKIIFIKYCMFSNLFILSFKTTVQINIWIMQFIYFSRPKIELRTEQCNTMIYILYIQFKEKNTSFVIHK